MIPKKIHYCWFGRGEKPKLAKKCIESWRKYCPDYEIIEWNEDNFDITSMPYLEYCHSNKKWAFLSDLARLIIVAEHGGLYFDTDVELIASPDSLLDCGAFFAFENKDYIATGLGFGSEAHHSAMLAMIGEYKALMPDENGAYPTINCPKLNTAALVPFGIVKNGEAQTIGDIRILPISAMNPYDDATGRLNKTEDTVSVHWYSKSWLSKKAIIRSKLTRPFHRLFGNNCFGWLKK